MKVLEDNIGKHTIFFQTIDDEEIEYLGQEYEGREIRPTGVSDIGKAYEKIKSSIKEITEDLGAELKLVSSGISQVEMELALGLSSEARLVLLNGRADASIKVKLVWNFNDDTTR